MLKYYKREMQSGRYVKENPFSKTLTEEFAFGGGTIYSQYSLFKDLWFIFIFRIME